MESLSKYQPPMKNTIINKRLEEYNNKQKQEILDIKNKIEKERYEEDLCSKGICPKCGGITKRRYIVEITMFFLGNPNMYKCINCKNKFIFRYYHRNC